MYVALGEGRAGGKEELETAWASCWGKGRWRVRRVRKEGRGKEWRGEVEGRGVGGETKFMMMGPYLSHCSVVYLFCFSPIFTAATPNVWETLGVAQRSPYIHTYIVGGP